MPQELMKWVGIVMLYAVALAFLLNKDLIPTLPDFIHYLIGGFIGIGALYATYKELK